VQNNI